MDYPPKPFCYQDESVFDESSSVCQTCPYFYPCGALIGHSPTVERKIFVKAMAEKNIPWADAVSAIQKAYDVSLNAAKLQYSKYRRRYYNP